jgi:DNA-binding NarL/FixJ family response regulator
MRSVRILIADDHDLVRRGLRDLLESHAGWEICGEATSGREAVNKTQELKPDVVILDISMPGLNGVEAARQIRKTSPFTEILILSMHHSKQLIREVIDAGVRGFIGKSDSNRDLVLAVEAIADHRPFFTPVVTEVILNKFDRNGKAEELPALVSESLTPREREIIQLLSEGKSAKEVASLLDISIKTTETHRTNIMRKLGIHNAVELVRYAMRTQIIEP